MKLTKKEWFGAGRWMGICLIVMGQMGTAFGWLANAQSVATTTVQGTVYLANGQPGTGTIDVSWPAFTTLNNQAVTAGRLTVTISLDGFMSANLAPNLGATPAGLYYTAVYHLSDGTTSTEYWVVPAAAEAALGQVRARLMPAAQAVQAVTKGYVDQAIAQLAQSLLVGNGGTMSGPLYLSGDPTQALQAADKHYVDASFGKAVPLTGANMTGPLYSPGLNGVQAPVEGSTQVTLQAAMSAAGTNGAVEIPPTYAGADRFTNPNGVHVTDLRQTGSQQFERSVKEFGAVCDGTTDDTGALQTAIDYAQTHGVALTIPQGTCKTHTLIWHGESIGGLGKQVSALMGFPGQDVLATLMDSTNLLANTRLHDLTIYVDQSVDVSCTAAEGRAPGGSCTVSRQLEQNSIFSQGGNGLNGTAGTGMGWAVGNCAIAMPAGTGAGGNGLRVAEISNLEIVATGVEPMAQYTGAHSTHSCGMYLAQWPQWSEFRNIDIRGLNTGIAIPALVGTAPAGLNADSNRWQNITIEATHGFTAAAGSNNVLDNVVLVAGNSAATNEPPTGLLLDLAGTQQGWTVRNAVVLPAWNAVQPKLTVTAQSGTVTGVSVGPEHGLGFDPYGMQVPLSFSGSCTATGTVNVNSDGSLGTANVTQGGAGCPETTTASANVAGTWDTAAPVNLIGGQNMTFFGGNLLKGNGGYTVWSATGSQNFGTQLGSGGGILPGGGTYQALVVNTGFGSAYQVDQFPGVDFGAKLQVCLGTVSTTYGGTCDARNFTGNLSMGLNLTISTANTTVLMPCATISTANQVVVTAGTRNVTLRGCALRGASNASGSQGGTVLLYSGAGAAVQVGDPTYAANTMGFHLDNVVINTTAGATATAKGLAAYRTQEMDLESLYFLGNADQTGMVLDGTGNYTGGTYFDNAFNGFQTAVKGIGHQNPNSATTDWLNASTFVRLHINCPTSEGSPISGTYGVDLEQGDGNTFMGGDVEGCNTALHLGANAQNNTIVGLRNENSTNQVVAEVGSAYNNWMTGGTMFTGQLTDNGTRNSFLDTFHRSFNGMNGDWYGSQKDATVTNRFRIGIGAGNERGLLDRYQTDYGYRWTTGLSDATAGEQYYQVLDELNNVNRLSIGQYNNGESSTNNQTVINAAGTGAVVLNGSINAGTGGVVFGSGGASEATVATISNTGSAQLNGTLQVGGTSTFIGTATVKNQADAEIDATLWAGLTANQKEAFTYKDYNGTSQWYMVKDANNNWALNSATGGLDSIKAYQSTNSGDTYINASNPSGMVRINYETGAGAGFNIYGGSSSSLYASLTGATAIKFPGLAATSGHNCMQIDNSGYISNTGSTCGSGGSGGTINTGTSGQIAYYAASGSSIGGTNTVPVTAGGTGAFSAASALVSLGAAALSGASFTGPVSSPALGGSLYADQQQSPAGTGNNGIAMSLVQCLSQTYACSIVAPALYSQVEAMPWGGVFAREIGFSTIGPKSSDPRGCVTDYRWGVPQWICNQGLNEPTGATRFAGSSPTFAMNVTTFGQGLNPYAPSALRVQEQIFAGGRDFNQEESSAIAFMSTISSHSSAGLYNYHAKMFGYSPSDNIPFFTDALTVGASLAQNEGLEGWRARLQEAGNVLQATLNSQACGVTCLFSMTQTQGTPGSYGNDVALIDLTAGYNTGYISSFGGVVTGSGTNWASTFGNTTATSTTTAAVSNTTGGNPSNNTFPQSNVPLTVTSSAGFSTGQLVCMFDSRDSSWQCAHITGVGSGTITVDRVSYPLSSGSTVAAGGLTGYGFGMDADWVSPGNSNGYAGGDYPPTGTIRVIYPIVSNTSGDALTIYTAAGVGQGTASRGYAQMTGSGGTATVSVSGGIVTSCTATGGSGYPALQYGTPQLVISGITYTTAPQIYVTGLGSGSSLAGCSVLNGGSGIAGTPVVTVTNQNPYHIYPMARTLSVYNAATGQLDGSAIVTTPISGTFSNGDTLEQPHYFRMKMSGLNFGLGQYQSGGQHENIRFSTFGNFGTNDYETDFYNANDPTVYGFYPPGGANILGRGMLGLPHGHVIRGPHLNGLFMTLPPYGVYNGMHMGAVYVGCGSSAQCAAWNTTIPVLAMANVNGSGIANDVFGYNPTTTAWSWTAGALGANGGSPGCTLNYGPTGLTQSGSSCGPLAAGSFAAPSGSWPSWLVPTVTNSTTAPSLAVVAGPIPNAALANSSVNVNGTTCTLGSLPCSVAITSSTTFRLAGVPLANTGSTTNNYVATIAIPAGVMSANSILEMTVHYAACTANGAPFAWCAAANTGTCSPRIYYSPTSGAGGVTAIVQGFSTLPAMRSGTVIASIQNTSNTTQINNATVDTYFSPGASTLTGSVNTAGAFYLNIFMQNSVSADQCIVTSAHAALAAQ